MPTVADESIVSIIWDYRLDGQQVLLTTNWRYRQELSPLIELMPMYDGIHTALAELGGPDAQVARCYADSAIQGTHSIQVTDLTRYVRKVYPSNNPTGTVVADCSPPGVAHCIILRTFDTGRHQRCVKHIGCVPTTFTTGGFINATGLAELSGLVVVLTTPLVFEVDAFEYFLDPIVLNRVLPTGSPIIRSGNVEGTTRVMRRRTVGLGS